MKTILKYSDLIGAVILSGAVILPGCNYGCIRLYAYIYASRNLRRVLYGSNLFDRGTYPVRYSDGGLAAFGSTVPAKGDGVVLFVRGLKRVED